MQAIDIIIGLPMPIPLLARPVRAGFPSPADDFIEEEIDIQRPLITNRPATFLVRVAGDSMVGARLSDGDLAEERPCKVWGRRRRRIALAAPAHPVSRSGADALVGGWGVVASSISPQRRAACRARRPVR